MRIHTIVPQELDATALARWRELQRRDPALANPCFCPEFTLAAAAVRSDVRVAVMEEGRAMVGFFPYQARWGLGRPVAAPLADHHGVIAAPGTPWRWADLMRATGLLYWWFDSLPAGQAPAGGHVHFCESPGLDLSHGFDAYKRGRVAASRRVAALDRKARRLARVLGPLRLETHTPNRAAFEATLRLKSQQWLRTAAPDHFAQPWARELAEQLWCTDTPDFAGRLTALYAGDTLVASHLGLRSAGVWHWWLPAYEPAHARHSPGALMLLMLAEAAAAEGTTFLDLGKGDEPYKASFATASLPLAQGCVARPGPAVWLRNAHAALPAPSAPSGGSTAASPAGATVTATRRVWRAPPWITPRTGETSA